MTIKELASLTNELYREGKGDCPVYFKVGPISYPVTGARENVITSCNQGIIELTWDTSKDPNYIEGKNTTV